MKAPALVSAVAVLCVVGGTAFASPEQDPSASATTPLKISHCQYPGRHPHRGVIKIAGLGPAVLPADGGTVPLTWDISAKTTLHDVVVVLSNRRPYNYFRPHHIWRIPTMKASRHYRTSGTWVVPPGWRGPNGSRNGMSIDVFTTGTKNAAAVGCEMFIPYAAASPAAALSGSPSFTARIRRMEPNAYKSHSTSVLITTDGRNIATDTVYIRHISPLLRVTAGRGDGPHVWHKDPGGYSYDLLHTSRHPGATYDHVNPAHWLDLSARKGARVGARACVIVTVKATDVGSWSKVVGPKKLCWTIAR